MEFGIRGTGVVTKLQFQFVGTDWGKRAKLKPRISDMDGGYKLQVIGGELNTCIGI